MFVFVFVSGCAGCVCVAGGGSWLFAYHVWLLTVSDSWNKGLEDTQVAWKTDLSQESLKGLSVLRHNSTVGAGAEGKVFQPPSPSPCADPGVGLGGGCSLRSKEKST